MKVSLNCFACYDWLHWIGRKRS